MIKSLRTLTLILLAGSVTACLAEEPKKVESEQKVKAEQVSVKSERPKMVLKAQKTSDGKLILGAREWVYVPDLKQNFRARVDTGATTSSISATDIETFKRNGKSWVRFKVEHDGIKSDSIELPVKRRVKILQSTADDSQRRAVVEAWIQIGDLKQKTEFTLADRTHLRYPLLLGRSFIKGVAVIDVDESYIQDKHK
ncbi:ATP-dependent zinc protease family protein [Vibrio japonicus]|uniref:ATP-dependent zinc protease n=1 Tax=Vibrio japonicus TaxID=1824638 RepID=A0ABY5LNE4_9VIBR|nr:ATP-dependent zinc protease [Vibrio japonicus]UUM32622.1 ATP-dependent zinc protease [Vibrio japonicus]